MDEIVDMCVGSIHLMARDPNNRVILRQLNSIPLFVQVATFTFPYSTIIYVVSTFFF